MFGDAAQDKFGKVADLRDSFSMRKLSLEEDNSTQPGSLNYAIIGILYYYI